MTGGGWEMHDNGREYLDHSTCPPGSHDFSLPDGWRGVNDDEQASDGHGHMACNHCRNLLFYCTRDDNYHHAGADAEPCFLVQEDGQDVPGPDEDPFIYDEAAGR